MRKYYLFELDKPGATDADYEAGVGDGAYVIYGPGGEVITKVETLDEAEALVKA
jgi:hypothetical protein